MTILIPKYKDIEAVLPGRRTRVAGRYKLTKGKTIGAVIDVATGLPILGTGIDVVTGETGWFNNIVTNNGLDLLGAETFYNATQYCHCGTGTGTETAGDTALGSYVATTEDDSGNTGTAQSSAPYYGSYTRTFRFAEGDAEGNIAEVGLGSSNSNTNLFTRARVKTAGGSPTTITVLDDEWLDVTYEFRLYPDHIDDDGSTDDGTGSITYDSVSYGYTIRPEKVNDSGYWEADQTMGYYGNVAGLVMRAYSDNATIGAVTSAPSASTQDQLSASSAVPTLSTYNASSYTRTLTLSIGLAHGNTNTATGGTGIKAISIYTGMGSYQIVYDAAIPKDSTKTITFVTNMAWTRATIP